LFQTVGPLIVRKEHAMLKVCAFSLAAAAGMAAAGGTPVTLQNKIVPEEDVGYVYINLATGERIATVTNEYVVSRDGNTSENIWIADNRLPCSAYGQTGGSSGLIDQISDTGPAGVGAYHLDWGDIPADTVVDCVQVRWSTRHIDVDADGDGFADGVVGFGCEWTWYDGDNGFNTCFTRTGITGFTLFNLPGRTVVPPGTALSVYTAIVDLQGDFTNDLSFEIGDTDGDLQGAAIHNAFFGIGDIDSDGILDGDLDSDGLADFSYGQRYFQPGTTDFDGDGSPDGDPAAAADCGNSLVAPTGPVVNAPPFDTISPVDPLPAAQGLEDAFDIFTDINSDGFFEPFGTFFYGGFTCDEDGDGVPGGNAANTRSFAQFWHVLLGPSAAAACPADLFPAGNPDGVLNFFDISTYLGYYNSQNPLADFFPVGAPDGLFNFFDISTFLAAYNAGCP
tara:strand:+ start:23428 stop:24777 length:1350 start_codon:yes stop_codon:yes gene_type:complete